MSISKNSIMQCKSGLVSLAILAAVGLSVGSANAAQPSQCKGLDNLACDTAVNCGWVEGYVRKDGREVKSFCRTTARAKSTKLKPMNINIKTKSTSTGS